jgi:hypothetical protein
VDDPAADDTIGSGFVGIEASGARVGRGAYLCEIGASPPELRIEPQPAVIAKIPNAIITDARGAIMSAGVAHLANQGTVFWFGNIIVKLLLAVISHGECVGSPAAKS